MFKQASLIDFKMEMGAGRKEREDILEQQQQELLRRISETEMPSWMTEDYVHGHPYGETYNDVREQLEEQPAGISYTSIVLIAMAAVLVIGGLVLWIANGCPWI